MAYGVCEWSHARTYICVYVCIRTLRINVALSWHVEVATEHAVFYDTCCSGDGCRRDVTFFRNRQFIIH